VTKSSEQPKKQVTVLTGKLAKALAYAIDRHVEPRKCTRIPYAAHLLEVCAIVLEDEGNETEAVAALLHDVVEDAGGTARLHEIREQFGPEVARIVEGCSDSLVDVTSGEEKGRWWARKCAYITRLTDEPPEVVRVSLADKVANARSIVSDYREIGESLWSRFKPESDQLWYYRSLLEAYRTRGSSRLVHELERSVEELEQRCQPWRRPIPVSYRIMRELLYAGEYPGSLDEHQAQEKVDALIASGVTVFLDLTEEDEDLLPYSHLLAGRAEHVRHPIRDGGIPSEAAMRVTLDELKAFLATGG
jgi:HD domain